MNLISALYAVAGLLLEVVKYGPLGAGIAAFTGVGAGIGMGIATAKAVDACARQPEAAGKIRTLLLLGLAFAETTALYGLVVAVIIFGS